MIRIDLRIRNTRRAPVCIGAGFVAMDIVEAENGRFAAVGGSCGNVMALLAWMGRRAVPVARLGLDGPGAFVREEFEEIGVQTCNLTDEMSVQTPVVIQRFVETEDIQRTHRFSLTCPECGKWLPRYRPTTLNHTAQVTAGSSAPKAYNFDQISPASLRLAEWAKQKGAMIVFEPSSIGDEHRFQCAVEICDVLKYSHSRLGHVPDLAKVASPRLVIEASEPDGLRVRWRGRWSKLPAYNVPRFIDAAGSGDWCTAGFIHKIAEGEAKSFKALDKARIDHSFRFGQALAALNCGFEGTRGAMMALTRAQMNKALSAMLESGDPVWDISDVDYAAPPIRLVARVRRIQTKLLRYKRQGASLDLARLIVAA